MFFQQQQPQQEKPIGEFRQGMIWANWLLKGFSSVWEPFMHRRMGEDYWNVIWVGVMWIALNCVVYIYWTATDVRPGMYGPVIVPRYDVRALMWFVHVWTVVAVLRLLGTIYRRLKGKPGHTYYVGESYWFKARFEYYAKRVGQPLIAIMLAFAALTLDEALGSVLLYSAGGLSIRYNLMFYQLRKQALQISNLQEEGEQLRDIEAEARRGERKEEQGSGKPNIARIARRGGPGGMPR